MSVTLVLQEINVLVALHAPKVILATALAKMMLITVGAAKHAAAVFAKRSSVRHTLLVAGVTLRTHADTIMPFLVVVGFLANLAVVVAAEVSRHCGDEVVVVFA